MRTIALAVCCIFAGLLLAQSGAHQNAFTPDQIKYGPPPPFVAPGAQVAVLEGDPTAATGDFTIWLKMPELQDRAALASQARKCDGNLREFQGRDGRPVG